MSHELTKLAGVQAVDVDLSTGTVTSNALLDVSAVRAAVDEAGHGLADPS